MARYTQLSTRRTEWLDSWRILNSIKPVKWLNILIHQSKGMLLVYFILSSFSPITFLKCLVRQLCLTWKSWNENFSVLILLMLNLIVICVYIICPSSCTESNFFFSQLMSRIMALSRKLTATDEQISCDQLYLSKVCLTVSSFYL